MKGTKKLKRILAVVTATFTMTAILSVTAMAEPATNADGWTPSDWLDEYWEEDHSETSGTYNPPLQIMEEETEHYYVKGSGNGVTIKCNGTYMEFLSVSVDGFVLENTNYTAVSGSTVLTMMPEYLDTLPVGAHTVTLNYSYGSIDSTLNVTESNSNAGNEPNDSESGVSNQPSNSENSVPNQDNNNVSAENSSAASTVNSAPKTGDTSAILFWAIAVLVSGSSCAVLIRRKRVNFR